MSGNDTICLTPHAQTIPFQSLLLRFYFFHARLDVHFRVSTTVTWRTTTISTSAPERRKNICRLKGGLFYCCSVWWDYLYLRGLGVKDLLELDAEFLSDALELSDVFVVLALVLDLGLDSCKEGMARQFQSL